MGYHEEGGTRLGWFLLGMGFGAAVALLYAPYKGKDARKILSRRADEAREFVNERGQELYERGRDIVEEAADLVDKGRKFARL